MKFVSMKKVHGGKFLSRYDIVYETIDGGRKNYEMVSRSGDRTEFHQLHDHDPEAVIMIMHDPSGEKILINREFRLAMGEFIYNFPAGLVDRGGGLGHQCCPGAAGGDRPEAGPHRRVDAGVLQRRGDLRRDGRGLRRGG